MQKLQKKDDIYAVVQFGFKNFALLARKNIKNNWNKFSLSEQNAANMGVKYIDLVAVIPGRFFAQENVYVGNIKPMTEVLFNSESALLYNEPLGRLFYRFCDAVQKWECVRDGETSAVHAEQKNIKALSNRIKRMMFDANIPVMASAVKKLQH